MVPPAAFPLAACSALGVTSFALYDKHGRHPFGDRRALSWWALIALADIFVAMLGLAVGVLKGGEALSSIGVIGWLTIGILVPLALRSPVRTVRLAGEDLPVGLTKFYDQFRNFCDRRLDDGITRLRRRDRARIIDRARTLGWTPVLIQEAFLDQVTELRSRTKPELEKIEAALASALSFPQEAQQFDGLLKVVFDEGLRSVLQDLKSSPPAAG